MRITVEFLEHPEREDESIRVEIAIFNEHGLKIASKYGITVRREHRADVNDIIQWAFVHGAYERAVEIKKLLEISPRTRELAPGEN
jgi:hypothetical protein